MDAHEFRNRPAAPVQRAIAMCMQSFLCFPSLSTSSLIGCVVGFPAAAGHVECSAVCLSSASLRSTPGKSNSCVLFNN